MSFAGLQRRCFSSTSYYTKKSHTFLEATFLSETDDMDMSCTQLRPVAKLKVVAGCKLDSVIAFCASCHI